MADLADLNAAATDWLAGKKKADEAFAASGLSGTAEYTPDDALRDILERELPFRRLPLPAKAAEALSLWKKGYLEDVASGDTAPSGSETWLHDVLNEHAFA